MDSGWQPYSIKTGEGYVSYLKMDPFAQFFGMSADIADAMRMAGDDDDDAMSNLAYGAMTAFANNFTQRSFLQGIGHFIDAVSDPATNMSAFVESYAGAVVPSNLSQLIQLTADDSMKDTHGMLEKIVSRVPGLSGGTTPRRNMLGEVVNRSKAYGEDAAGAFYGMFVPIAYREVSSDHLRIELANLKHGFSPPSAKVQGLDLREFENDGQDALDRWSQLHGHVKIKGKTLRQELSNLIRSPKYLKLTPESSVSEESPRVRLIRAVLSRYRSNAFEMMLNEYPEVARELQAREERKQSLRQGLAVLNG
jgi:hypothetical protein